MKIRKKKSQKQSQKQLGAKIASYSVLAASFLAFDIGAQAQSFCPTVNPSVFPTPMNGYLYEAVDLDGDGEDDFIFYIDSIGRSAVNFGSIDGSMAVVPSTTDWYGFYGINFSSNANIGSSQSFNPWVGYLNYGYGSSSVEPNVQFPPGTTGNIGLRLLLDCDGDGSLTDETHSYAYVNVTTGADGAITVNSVGYDCSGATITPAGVQAACNMVPTIGQWAQMCLALFFMSTGVIYLNRREEVEPQIS